MKKNNDLKLAVIADFLSGLAIALTFLWQPELSLIWKIVSGCAGGILIILGLIVVVNIRLNRIEDQLGITKKWFENE